MELPNLIMYMLISEPISKGKATHPPDYPHLYNTMNNRSKISKTYTRINDLLAQSHNPLIRSSTSSLSSRINMNNIISKIHTPKHILLQMSNEKIH
ncbi:hypothetical protein KFK09_016354 [Dendrobium nobile]|uniref:Uncharacterized protein n=1 Tax=Dendrobium nobile TaxID=94219 RepID=A0A8T3AYH0_DENNO|nr:hypothetical protein KFK09_016354 [Dendrobium nobile]